MRCDPPSDETLLDAIRHGDADALATLFRRHAPALAARLARRGADPGMVDDVIQETFLAAWRGARQYQGRGAVGAWLWGICLRRLVAQFRRRPAPTLPLGEAASCCPSAEDQVLESGHYGAVAAALHRLPAELRQAVQLTALYGLTAREAAGLLGVPAGTVKTRMMRARTRLRSTLT